MNFFVKWLMGYNVYVRKEGRIHHQEWDGKRIRALRKHLRLTQCEMAEMLDKYQQGISEWERGLTRLRPSSSKLLSIIAQQAKFNYQTTSSKKTVYKKSYY